MNALTTKESQAEIMEGILLGGDLSKLNPAQRVSYYQKVCETLGLNPYTKPFDYIKLNDKLTLYAKKDATDQLRKINKISIVDVNIVETEKQFIVKVKGQDPEGRTDMEVGVVNKSDMRGDTANAQMKAVTKAKRRLTLSMCGLGWLDETEVETIPSARPVIINDETGDIIQPAPENINQETGEASQALILVDPMSFEMVQLAAKEWNLDASEAAKQISSLKLGHRIEKAEFIQIIKEENKTA